MIYRIIATIDCDTLNTADAIAQHLKTTLDQERAISSKSKRPVTFAIETHECRHDEAEPPPCPQPIAKIMSP